MKKIIGLSVATLLMMGSVSQAFAGFEAGNFILSVYDKNTNQEIGIDLGTFTDLKAMNQTVKTGLDFSLFTGAAGYSLTNAGIGIFSNISDLSNNHFEGYFGVAKAPTLNTGAVNGSSFAEASGTIGSWYNTSDTDQDGYVLTGINDGSYVSNMNITTAGGYAGVNKVAAKEAEIATAGYVDIMLYHFTTLSTGKLGLVTDLTNYDDTRSFFRLTSDGNLTLNPSATSEVPVPGAVWLLGAGLAGLIGVRRKKVS